MVRCQRTGLVFCWVRRIRIESDLQTSPEQGVRPSAVLLGDAVPNLMTHGQVHLISNAQG